MQNERVLKRHASLIDRMAGRTGVDLEEAVLRGELPADEVPEMVLRCTSCLQPDDCERMLSEPGASSAPPAYCRNAQLFNELTGRG